CLAAPDPGQRRRDEPDPVEEPHPAIELGLTWVAERLRPDMELVVTHGDWRIGNLVVDEDGLVAVLDWEFAHLADPVEDVAWPLVRAGRVGGGGAWVWCGARGGRAGGGGAGRAGGGGGGGGEPYLDRYNALTGRALTLD